MVTSARPGPPVPPPPPSPEMAPTRSPSAPFAPSADGVARRSGAASALGAPEMVVWTLTAFVAVVLYAVSVPIDAAVYHVHVAIAFGVALLQAGSLLLAMWSGSAAVTAFLAGQVLVGVFGTADPGLPWPMTPPQLILLCALLVVLTLRGRVRWAMILWVGALVLPLAVAFLPDHGATPDGVIANLVTSAAVSALVLGAAIAVMSGRARMDAELDEQRAETLAEYERRVVAEERTRIAREMHDVVAHSMSIIQVQAASAPYRLAGLDDATTAEFAEIAASARSAMAEMRQLLTVLRDPDGEAETAPQPGLAELPELIASVERAGAPISLEVASGAVDDGPAARAAYRIVQESLSNVLRHAPGAATVVTVRAATGKPAALDVTVRNEAAPDAASGPVPAGPVPAGSASDGAATAGSASDGAGGAARASQVGHGLIGIRERARLLGGRIESGPTADGGFEVHAVLPLGAPADRAEHDR